MGIERKTPAQLQQLKDTLLACPHIEEVHFTDSGDHFFTVHELVEKGKRTGRKYGYQKLKPVVVKSQGDRRVFKHESVHTPHTLISQTRTRDEVLAFDGDSGGAGGRFPTDGRRRQTATTG
jgi:hypothetical protein